MKVNKEQLVAFYATKFGTTKKQAREEINRYNEAHIEILKTATLEEPVEISHVGFGKFTGTVVPERKRVNNLSPNKEVITVPEHLVIKAKLTKHI